MRGAWRSWVWYEFREFPQVLGGGGEEELVVGTALPSEPQSVELHDPLKVSEEHLDLLAVVAGLPVSGRSLELPDDITGGFVHASRDFAHGLAGAAFRLEGAGPAIELAGTIDPGLGLGDAAAWPREVAPILLEGLSVRPERV